MIFLILIRDSAISIYIPLSDYRKRLCMEAARCGQDKRIGNRNYCAQGCQKNKKLRVKKKKSENFLMSSSVIFGYLEAGVDTGRAENGVCQVFRSVYPSADHMNRSPPTR